MQHASVSRMSNATASRHLSYIRRRRASLARARRLLRSGCSCGAANILCTGAFQGSQATFYRSPTAAPWWAAIDLTSRGSTISRTHSSEVRRWPVGHETRTSTRDATAPAGHRTRFRGVATRLATFVDRGESRTTTRPAACYVLPARRGDPGSLAQLDGGPWDAGADAPKRRRSATGIIVRGHGTPIMTRGPSAETLPRPAWPANAPVFWQGATYCRNWQCLSEPPLPPSPHPPARRRGPDKPPPGERARGRPALLCRREASYRSLRGTALGLCGPRRARGRGRASHDCPRAFCAR